MKRRLLYTTKQLISLSIIAVLGLSFIAPMQTASALSARQKQIMDAGIKNFDIDAGGQCTVNGVAGLTLEQEIAQTLWVGFDGTATTDTIKAVVDSNYVGGIFFTNDFNTSQVNKDFFASIQPDGRNKMLIAADDEGGRVKTFAKDTPSAAQMTNLPIAEIRTWGQKTGKAMADAGLNTNLSPVLDIQTPGTLWTQTERNWSSDPGQIERRAGTFASGLKDSGIAPVYKHFPGIGKIGANGAQPNNTDKSPTAPQSLDSMTNDLKPYEGLIKNKTDGAVMLSNGYIDKWNGGTVPVSMSPDAVNYLRTTMAFQGLITTDALNSFTTYGSKAMDLPTAVANSLAAGVDMPLFVVQANTADKTIKDIIAAVKAKNIPQAIIDDAYKNTLKMRGITDGAKPASGPNSNTNSSASQCCDTGSIGGGSITGSGQVEIIMNYMLQQGFTVAGAAAAIGNMKVESSPNLKPNIQQGGSNWPKGGWGLIQWTGGRRITLVDFITKPPYNLSRLYVEDKSSELNLSADDNAALMKAELDFMMKELTESYQSTLTIGKTATDARKAAADWELAFEGCSPTWGTSGCDVPLRQQYAQEIFDKFKGTTAPAAGATPISSGATCTGGVNGGTASGKNAVQPPQNGVGLSVYYYSQCPNADLGQDWTSKGNGYNYCSCACGQSSTASIVASLKGDPNVTPITVYNSIGDSGSQGSAIMNPSSCSGSLVSALIGYMKDQGLQTNLVQGRGNGGLDPTKVFNELKQGHLLLVHTSKWITYSKKNYTSGHYLMIYAADADGQNFYVMNPGGVVDKGVAIPASGINEWLDEAYAVWK